MHAYPRFVFSLSISILAHCCALPNAQGQSSSAVLVKDLNRAQTATYRPIAVREIRPATSHIYFAATTEIDAFGRTRDLWRSNGTVTERLLTARDESLAPRGLSAFGAKIVFAGRTADLGAEPYIVSPTSSTPVLLADIATGPEGSDPSGFRVGASGRLYFLCETRLACELWSSDGTRAGTRREAQFRGYTRASREIGYAQSTLYFALSKAGIEELWRSDGSSAGTKLVHRFTAAHSEPHDFLAFGSRVYFRTRAQGLLTTLWRSDGTSAGTRIVANDVTTAAVVFASKLYFGRTHPATGAELAVSDGTARGTKTLELLPGTLGSDPEELTVIGSRLYFGAWSPLEGRETWVSDGTLAGSRLLGGDLRKGSTGLDPGGFVRFGKYVAFRSDKQLREGALWLSDGTARGSFSLFGSSLALVSGRIAISGQLAFFAGRRPNRSEIDLYFTLPRTGVVRKISPSSKPKTPHSDGSYPSYFQAAGDRVLFRSYDGKQAQLSESKGDAPSTKTLAPVEVLPSKLDFPAFGRVGGKIFFAGLTMQNSLHVSDGTARGTTELVSPGSLGTWNAPWSFLAHGTELFFHALHLGNAGVYSSKGSGSCTLLQLPIGSQSRVSELVSFAGAVYCVEETMLHRIDASGARVVAQSTQRVAPAQRLLRFGRELAFASSDSSGAAIQLYDGKRLRSVRIGASGEIHELVRVRKQLFVRRGTTLWVSDASQNGTKQIASGVRVTQLMRVGSMLYFVGRTGPNGSDVWRSDGTATGTRRVADLRVGPESEDVALLASFGTGALFATPGGALWLSDGSAQGTRIVRAASGRALVSLASQDETTRFQAAAHFRGQLLVSARASALGEEIWSVSPGACVREVGRASAAPTTRNPRMTSNAPRLGKPWTLEGSGFDVGRGVLIFAGSTPATLAIGTAEFYLDPASFFPFAAVANKGADWTLRMPFPNDRNLLGISAGFQCIQATNARLGFDLSNAIEVTVGR